MTLADIFDYIAMGNAIRCCDAAGRELFNFPGFGEADYDPYITFDYCIRCKVDFFFPEDARKLYVQLDEIVEDFEEI
jgi:hypothetical protein